MVDLCHTRPRYQGKIMHANKCTILSVFYTKDTITLKNIVHRRQNIAFALVDHPIL